MNIALYLRVSTDAQDLEPQRLELTNYAQARGHTVQAEYSDILSGAKAARPGLLAMLEAAKAGQFQAVAAVKMDRYARSLQDFVRITSQLSACGCGLICTGQGIDTSAQSPEGRLMASLLAAFAEFERELIRSRTRAGLAVARKAGKVLGRPSPVLTANPAPIVAQWRAEGGQSYGTLAKRLGGVSKSTAWRLANK